jgi:hypothetical protein
LISVILSFEQKAAARWQPSMSMECAKTEKFFILHFG